MKLNNLSIEDLQSLLSISKNDILNEIEKRNKKKFNHEISDCFLCNNILYKITNIIDGYEIIYDYIHIFENHVEMGNDFTRIENHHFDKMKKIDIEIFDMIEEKINELEFEINQVKGRYSLECQKIIKDRVEDYQKYDTYLMV